jgi:glycosyltransferase involved in cell wall biosynthesis
VRIGVDGGCWSNARGYGRYTRELVAALAELVSRERLGAVRLYVDRQTADAWALPPAAEIAVAETREAASRAARSGGRRSVHDLWAYRSAAARDRLDVFFFPSVYSYFPLRRGVPAVVAVHDAIAEALPRLVFPRLRERALWALKVRAALRRARRVVTVSGFAREELVRWHGLVAEEVAVVPEAPAAAFTPPRGGPDPAVLGRHGIAPDRPFFLYVGGLAPHKNLPAAIDAVAALAAEPGGAGLSLVLAGDHARDVFLDEAADLEARIAALPPGTVRVVGFVPDEDLVHLYAAARATLLPSFREGFGLPVFEAAACGGAAIATRASAAPELLGQGCLLVDPERPQELAAAMGRVLADDGLRARLGAEGRRRTAGLSWGRSAAALLEVLREAAAPAHRAGGGAATARRGEWSFVGAGHAGAADAAPSEERA